MKRINLMLMFICGWFILVALFSNTFDLYVSLSLIGFYLFLETGHFFITKKNKKLLNITFYFLSGLFSIVVVLRIYSLIM